MFDVEGENGRMCDKNEEAILQHKIQSLQHELDNTRARLELKATTGKGRDVEVPAASPTQLDSDTFNSSLLPSHPLLLLTDSALPLGSFAFSNGLESFLAHHSPAHNAQPNTFHKFMHMSVLSLASTTLPYLLAAFKTPARIADLDDALDACLLCPVARRASTNQGRALITVWERSLRGETAPNKAQEALQDFCSALKAPKPPGAETDIELNAHFPLIYALVCAAQGLSLHEVAFTYLFNHAKAVASAAVRASVLGPYAAQALLGSKWLRKEIECAMEREWTKDAQETGQTVPVLDLWIGRHELLYSRIFNS